MQSFLNHPSLVDFAPSQSYIAFDKHCCTVFWVQGGNSVSIGKSSKPKLSVFGSTSAVHTSFIGNLQIKLDDTFNFSLYRLPIFFCSEHRMVSTSLSYFCGYSIYCTADGSYAIQTLISSSKQSTPLLSVSGIFFESLEISFVFIKILIIVWMKKCRLIIYKFLRWDYKVIVVTTRLHNNYEHYFFLLI